MADIAGIVGRARQLGGNVMLDGNRLKLVNRAKLSAEMVDALRQHAREVADFLEREGEFEERAAIMEHDGGLTRPAAEYMTRLLIKNAPRGTDAADWSWFCSQAIQIVERHFARAA